MTNTPQWMHKLEAAHADRRAEEARISELEAKAKAAHGRMLGAALVEVLALVLDVALPAPDVNKVVLDGVAFSLSESDIEPITERGAGGAPVKWLFTLLVGPEVPTISPVKPRWFAFASGNGPGWHAEQIGELADYVMGALAEIRLYAASATRSVFQLVQDMRAADNLRAAEAAESLWSDYEFDGHYGAVKLVAAALIDRRPEFEPIRDFLLFA